MGGRPPIYIWHEIFFESRFQGGGFIPGFKAVSGVSLLGVVSRPVSGAVSRPVSRGVVSCPVSCPVSYAWFHARFHTRFHARFHTRLQTWFHARFHTRFHTRWRPIAAGAGPAFVCIAAALDSRIFGELGFLVSHSV